MLSSHDDQEHVWQYCMRSKCECIQEQHITSNRLFAYVLSIRFKTLDLSNQFLSEIYAILSVQKDNMKPVKQCSLLLNNCFCQRFLSRAVDIEQVAFFWDPFALHLCSEWWDPSLGYSFQHMIKYLWVIQNLANWATWELYKKSLTFQAFKLNTTQNQWISKMNWSKKGWMLGCATVEMLDDSIYRRSW